MTILLPSYYFIACCCLLFKGANTAFFFHERILQPHTNKRFRKQISTLLYAKAKNRSVSGFGGAAVQECPCGSGMGYMKCCGKLHRDVQSYVNATAEQVVRARYSAYALREVCLNKRIICTCLMLVSSSQKRLLFRWTLSSPPLIH
jgi:hypothetical protein